MARPSRRTGRNALFVRAAAAAALTSALATGIDLGPWARPLALSSARADDALARRPFPSRESASRPGGSNAAAAPGAGSSGWWLGTVGVAIGLAVCGWASVAARRWPGRAAASGATGIRVLGRTSLSPKHSVYLVEVGRRVLILGAGPQGAPSLLGELSPTDNPPEPVAVAAAVAARPTSHARFDHRLGDDE